MTWLSCSSSGNSTSQQCRDSTGIAVVSERAHRCRVSSTQGHQQEQRGRRDVASASLQFLPSSFVITIVMPPCAMVWSFSPSNNTTRILRPRTDHFYDYLLIPNVPTLGDSTRKTVSQCHSLPRACCELRGNPAWRSAPPPTPPVCRAPAFRV